MGERGKLGTGGKVRSKGELGAMRELGLRAGYKEESQSTVEEKGSGGDEN